MFKTFTFLDWTIDPRSRYNTTQFHFNEVVKFIIIIIIIIIT